MVIDKSKLEKEIKVIVATVIEKEPNEIASDDHFIEDLDMDSMMALEILAALENKYKIVIPEDQLPKITSITKVLDLVTELKKQGEEGGLTW